MNNKFLRFFTAIVIAAASAIAYGAPQYYGYYQNDSGTSPSLTAASANQSNISWSSRGGSLSLIVSDLQTAASNNEKLVVDVSAIFFDGDHLRAGYASNWASFVNTINNSGYAGYIAAFYPQDEPGPSFSDSDLTTAISLIKSNYPSIPVGVIYAFDSNANYRAIGSFDWVGIDCYSNGAWNCNGTNYTAAYMALKAHASSSAKTILVPQSSTLISSPSCCVAALQAEAARFYQLSLADPSVVIIAPFIWQNIAGTGYYGLSDSHSSGLTAIYQTIGSDVKNHVAYPAGYQPVFRFFNISYPDHLFTLSGSEGLNAGYDFERIGFSVITSQVSGSEPVFRCSYAGKHFVSNSSNCEGHTTEALLGYMYGYQANNTTALYRFTNPNSGDILSTTNYAEGAGAGLTYNGIIGYTPVVSLP